MSKRFVVRLLFAGAILVGLFIGAGYVMNRGAIQIISTIQQGLPVGSTLTYDALESSLLQRQVTLTNLKVSTPAYTFSAGNAVLQGVPTAGNRYIHLGHAAVTQAVLSLNAPAQGGNFTFTADTASVDALDLQTGVTGRALLQSDSGFDALELKNLRLSGPDGQSMGSVDTLQVGPYRNKIFSSVVIENAQAQLSAVSSGQDVKLAHLQAENVNLAAVSENLSSPLSLLVHDYLGNLTLSGFSLQGAAGAPLAVQQLQISGESGADTYRKSLKIDATGIVFPLYNAPAEMQAAFGLTSSEGALNAEIHAAANHDVETRLLSLSEAKVIVSGQGILSAKGALSGVSSLTLIENPAGLAAVSFNELAVTYTDLGMAKRRVQSEAQRMAVMPDVYAEQIMNRLAPQLEPLGQRGLRIRNALYAFLLDPHYLSFSAKPAQPVSMLQLLPLMRAPAQVADLLGIFVSSEPLQSLPASTP